MNLSGEQLLPNIKRWKSSTAQVVGEGKSGSWGGARVQTHQKYVLPQLFVAVVSEEKTEDH